MTFRMLPPDEWWKLKPLLLSDEQPDAEAGVFVLEDEGQIVACRVLKQILWAGGMYVHPERRRQGIATELQRRVEESLQQVGFAGSYFMAPATPESEATVQSFGFTKLPLTLYRKEL
jgi:GNAT superfamily N-acetyltransferase